MRKIEFYTGVFILFGLFCFAYIALSLGGLSIFGDRRYTLYANFVSTSGLKAGAVVEIAGVEVGNATTIELKNNKARLTLRLKPNVLIPADSIASIRTRGLIGEKFVKITPGADDLMLKAGEEIDETESVVDLEELIGKFIFDGDKEDDSVVKAPKKNKQGNKTK
ncbi:MAG: putative phospholipid ABC transporter-binding protein MlaD [Turneriella sp.]|nr:putative phospholipid ABC transporter-binding protein MlaD [Turneriella sp.]